LRDYRGRLICMFYYLNIAHPNHYAVQKEEKESYFSVNHGA
jgi:hypothetical protein